MKQTISSIFLVLSFQFFVYGQIGLDFARVKKIILLTSNRKDVQRLFSKSKFELNGYDTRFLTKDSEIEISYSAGRCKEVNGRWNVPKWTVIEIYITPKAKIYPRQLGFKLSQFSKASISDIDGGKVYRNEAKGIEFTTSYGKLTNLLLFPSKKYNYLTCREQ